MHKLVACLLVASSAWKGPGPVPAGDALLVSGTSSNVGVQSRQITRVLSRRARDGSAACARRAGGLLGHGPFSPRPKCRDLYNAIGAQYRVLSALVPESPMRAELVEFKDVDRKPVRPRIQDPGASILVLTVRDLSPIMARAKSSAALVTGGGAVPIGEGSQEVLLSDPDGFFVEVVQRPSVPAAKGTADSNLLSVSFAFVVSDANRMSRVFQDALGFELKTGVFGKDRNLEKLLNVQGFEVRRTTTMLPGTSFPVEFLEFKGTDRKPVHSRLQDPGSAVLRLVVRDVDTSVKRLNSSGIKIASAGGEVITLPGGGSTIRAAIGSAPDNLFVQVLQAPATPVQPARR